MSKSATNSGTVRFGLTYEEAHKIAKQAVAKYWNDGMFGSLHEDRDMEDVLGIVMETMLRRKYVEKYNGEGAGQLGVSYPGHYIFKMVRNCMLDQLQSVIGHKTRWQRYGRGADLPLDQANEQEQAYQHDIIEDPRIHVEEDFVGTQLAKEIFTKLPAFHQGDEVCSPCLGTCRYSIQGLFLHLLSGYTAKELMAIYHQSFGRISSDIKKIQAAYRELALQSANV